jgi:Cof subfamily protein (haloacid dehalogenase superfamily)
LPEYLNPLSSASLPQSKLKAIALDLDGTLLNSQGHVSQPTLNALLAARAAGTRIVLASGRMATRIFPVAALLGPPVTVISFNGARIQEFTEAGNIVTTFTSEIPHAFRREIVNLCRERRLFLNVYSGDILFGYHPDGDYRFGEMYHRQNGATYAGFHDDPEQLPDREVAKLLVITAPEDREPLYRDCVAQFAQSGSIVKSNPEYLEFMDKGVTKGSALRYWMQGQGMQPTGVMAFGDAENDLEMLQSVEHGIAVSNASPGLKAAHARISDFSNDEDVIVREMKKLGFMAS